MAKQEQQKVNTTVDVTQVLIGYDGDKITEVATVDKKPTERDVTLRMILCRSLMAQLPQDQQLQGEKKIELFVLAQRIHREDKVTFTTAELELLNSRVTEAFSAAVVGPVACCLNPATVEV